MVVIQAELPPSSNFHGSEFRSAPILLVAFQINCNTPGGSSGILLWFSFESASNFAISLGVNKIRI